MWKKSYIIGIGILLGIMYLSSTVHAVSTTLLVERFTYQATGISEYVKIKNISASGINLSMYRAGDEETKGGGEGMYFLPNITLGSGDSIIVAKDADDWSYANPAKPDYSFAANDVGVPVLTRDTSWATGSVALSNTGDEVIIIDGSDNLVDGSCYGSSACTLDNGLDPDGHVEAVEEVINILADGALADLPSAEAGYKRNSDVDTDTQADWQSNPTAISLSSLSATGFNPGILSLALAAILAIGAGAFILRRRAVI